MFYVAWFFLSLLAAVYAVSKGRSAVGWFFFSLILSPLIAFITLLVVGPREDLIKKCPKCAEMVKAEAVICRFCHYEFSPDPTTIQKPPPAIPKEEGDKLMEARDRIAKIKYGG